ncbi:MAG TPA: glutamyl-tRNA amidotransferase [Firmicutes bacterium]|nr:glutamyl-tRNA amidotransferase [Bacillota bacterium]
MALTDMILSDMTKAMKNQEKFELSVLRMLKSALQMEKINLKHDLSDEEAMVVIKRQVKQRKDSINEYEKYGKTSEVENLNNEISILSKYLPEEISEDQINAALDDIFAELKPESMKDMGRVMKEATSRLGAGADGSLLSQLVRNRLNK